jgi:hypothetical protein
MTIILISLAVGIFAGAAIYRHNQSKAEAFILRLKAFAARFTKQ